MHSLLPPKKLDFGLFNHVLRLSVASYAAVTRQAMTPGCFVTVISADADKILLPPTLFGEVPVTDRARCSFMSAEQATRLRAQPLHVSSWQSRDEKAKPFGRRGGAVKGRTPIISVAGLTEHGNEAVALTVAVLWEELSLDNALVISNMSNNVLFSRMGLAG